MLLVVLFVPLLLFEEGVVEFDFEVEFEGLVLFEEVEFDLDVEFDELVLLDEVELDLLVEFDGTVLFDEVELFDAVTPQGVGVLTPDATTVMALQS